MKNEHNIDSNSFKTYHQNICGLKSKIDEIISSLLPTPPHILCFSEHHLKYTELDQINVEGFTLCTAYCRQTMKKGGVCIFAQNGLKCSKIDVNKYCKDQDIEIFMLNFITTSFSLHIMVVYRAPKGDFNYFLNRLDDSIKSIYKTNLNLILCGEINIDYLLENDRKKQLDSMLQTYNLTAIVHFPTRSQGRSITMIDNIFLDTFKLPSYTVLHFFNSLSDHDAQLLTLKDLNLHDLNSQVQNYYIYTARDINEYSINKFRTNLSYETWDCVSILKTTLILILCLILF